MEEKGARVVVVKGVRNIKYFLIASSLPCVAAIQQSLHEDYELTQGKQLKRSRALYIYIYIYINGYTSGCTKEREVRSEIKLYLYIFFQVSFSFCVFDHLMFLK
jgi:hypothetical protein